MGKWMKIAGICAGMCVLGHRVPAQAPAGVRLAAGEAAQHARPWVYWYWMNSLVSRQGVRKDLLAMHQAGIGGAYLMPVHVSAYDHLQGDTVKALTPAWWRMLSYTFHLADSLGIELGMAAGDGWATAGGPWITPALSMQRVVWSRVNVKGPLYFQDTLPVPPAREGYYRDIAVYAYPSPRGTGSSSLTIRPRVTTSTGADARFLALADNQQNFVSHQPCWIQYDFGRPFSCRSLKITVRGIAFQAFRLRVDTSSDGRTFHMAMELKPPRSGWADYEVPEATYATGKIKARYFRFVYDPAGTEPGSEDLDAAKWKPTLKLCGITLYGIPQIDQFEGKNGSVWRVGDRTTAREIPDSVAVPLSRMILLSKELDSTGRLTWKVPPGHWTILRMGHTSTGTSNATAGAALGLEADKFNPAALTLQFDRWFGAVYRHLDSAEVSRVMKVFHVDSWECGSQNWSPVFRKAFIHYRGYDPLTYLPAMAGVPVGSAEVSERFLYDVRRTISDLIEDNFFSTMDSLARSNGCAFSAESVAPVMVSDGMAHAGRVEIPMGEFWLRSPTHDKPTDILDAVSGGHIYGKPMIQAEAFTELREGWDEYPGMLKTLLDRNYALGVNRVVYHVFTENPWTNREPGMTLTGVGTYFQRDQTWWKPGRAWVAYATRCQRLLQRGLPVNDIAVFTGWEIPRRALTADRLIPFLPGLFGRKILARERARLRNQGEPLQEIPSGIKSEKNTFNPGRWIDPLRGYGYDCINEDALLRLASVNDGRIVLKDGVSYGLLVIPGDRRMQPEGDLMTAEVANDLVRLVKQGATILIMQPAGADPGLSDRAAKDAEVKSDFQQLTGGVFRRVNGPSGSWQMKALGKGRVIRGPFQASSLAGIGITPDLTFKDPHGSHASEMAWTHRVVKDSDIYFISNQLDSARTLEASFRVAGKVPEIYNPVTGTVYEAGDWRSENGRTVLLLRLPPGGSLFVFLAGKATRSVGHHGLNWKKTVSSTVIGGPWKLRFDTAKGGPASPVIFPELRDWRKDKAPAIRYYSGTVVYRKQFNWKGTLGKGEHLWLSLGDVYDVADVRVNGKECGVAWTRPYEVDVTPAVVAGENSLEISVTNTWRNRLIGDRHSGDSTHVTWTTAPDYLKDKPLLSSGLLGPVTLKVTRR